MAEILRVVFLSYASEDAAAAERICEALRGQGIEVWFDKSQLKGGDVWDQRIRFRGQDGANMIKGIVARSGDKVRTDIDRSVLNGHNTSEPFACLPQQSSPETPVHHFLYGAHEITVPPGEVFVMGDHRTASEDSRDYGPIDESRIIGTVKFRLSTMWRPNACKCQID